MERSHWALPAAVVVVLTCSSACVADDPAPVAPVSQSVSSPPLTPTPVLNEPQPIPDGTYSTTATRERAEAAGFDKTVIDQAYGPDGTLEIVLRLQNGLWTQLATYDGVALEPGDEGSYEFEADKMVLTSTSAGCPGCVGVVDFTFDGQRLALQFADPEKHDPVERLMTEHSYTLQD